MITERSNTGRLRTMDRISGIDYPRSVCRMVPNIYRSLIYFGCEDGFSPGPSNSFVRILAGMSSRDFCNEYKLRCIEDYLRYTDLPGKGDYQTVRSGNADRFVTHEEAL